MKRNSAKCPSCGSNLRKIKSQDMRIRCMGCGTVYMVSHEGDEIDLKLHSKGELVTVDGMQVFKNSMAPRLVKLLTESRMKLARLETAIHFEKNEAKQKFTETKDYEKDLTLDDVIYEGYKEALGQWSVKLGEYLKANHQGFLKHYLFLISTVLLLAASYGTYRYNLHFFWPIPILMFFMYKAYTGNYSDTRTGELKDEFAERVTRIKQEIQEDIDNLLRLIRDAQAKNIEIFDVYFAKDYKQKTLLKGLTGELGMMDIEARYIADKVKDKKYLYKQGIGENINHVTSAELIKFKMTKWQ